MSSDLNINYQLIFHIASHILIYKTVKLQALYK